MPIQADLNREQRLKMVSFRDHVTAQEFADYASTLSVDHMSSYDIAFIDLSQMTQCDFGHEMVSMHVRRVCNRNTQTFVEIILAPTDLSYGMGRMYASMAETQVDVRLFRDALQAHQELAGLLASKMKRAS